MTYAFNPKGLSAILIGDESLTIACGDMMLSGGHVIAKVVTRDENVRAWAERHNLEICKNPRDLLAQPVSADWVLSVANLRMIPSDVLLLAKKGAVNFHDGPLPRYAGLNTPAWAIINGETEHGVSWHMIEGGVDEGDLLAQKLFAIAPDETAFSLNSKCYAAGMESFSAVLSQLEAGQLNRIKQDLNQRSYFARDQRPENMGILDFTQSASRLSALARGLDFGTYWNPLVCLKLALGDQIFCVGELTVDQDQNGHRGSVLSVSETSLTVAAAQGAVVLSGVTDFDGKAIELEALFSTGMVLPHVTLAPFSVKDEAHWQHALHLPAVTCPFAKAGQGGEDRDTVSLKRPAKQDEVVTAAAASLVILGAAATNKGMISLGHKAQHPLALDWVPLALSAAQDMPIAEFLAQITRQQHQVHNTVGVLRDLGLRDPVIEAMKPSDIAISYEDQLVEGSVATIVIGKTCKLISDPLRISPAGVELLKLRLETAFVQINKADTCGVLWGLSPAEAELLQSWNATERAYDRTTIHASFEAQVARTPDATALVFETEALSYQALNLRANRVAHTLRSMGAKPGTPIGLATTRSVDLLVGALGILKAGGAYVPLDPAYPSDRIAHYIADSKAPIIVTQSSVTDTLPDHKADVLLLDADARLTQAATDNPEEIATPEDLAYLIYTSGSTGTPKGVMVNHGNVANFFAGMDDRIDHSTGSVWLAVTSLSFDISVLELFWTLARGFKLVLAGDESRTLVSNGPIGGSAGKLDFNLMYWGNDGGVGPKKYELLLEGAKFADDNGFNAVWTPERHFHAFGGPYPNPSVTGAAVAAVTKNLSVRAGSCVAPLHHTARIAEEWAVIDNLTNGRAGLAIASGWQPDDFVLRPENTPPANKPAMYDAIDQLRQLWRGEAVSFPKQDGTMHPVITQPRPVSSTLPIWVTTAGNPQTWKEAGEIGAHVLTHLLGQSIDEVAEKITIYHDALRGAGHDPADFTVSLMLHAYLDETRERAEEIARGPMKDYLRSAAGLIKQYAWAFPAFKKPEGATSPFDVNLEGLNEEELDAILEFAFQRYFHDSGMFGTIEDGVRRAEDLKAIGVTEVACLIDYGIETDLVLEGLKPLAEVLKLSNREVEVAEDDFSLAGQIIRHGVTHLQCTPSMAQMLVTNEEAQTALGQVQHVMVGGEALPASLVTALQSCTDATLQNMYGPTETTIWSTTQMVQGDTPVTAPVGTPIANTQVFILTDKMSVQPIGIEGELWIGGDGVTDGYWQRTEMTADRFPDNPFGPGKIYRTGDLAAWDADGILHFAGRADAQVKIRGHRIELGEIEARLAEQPAVTQAVVIARDAPGGAQLVGYVTTTGLVDSDAIKRELAADLPAIMIPSAIVTLEKMPLTPNKKIDRKALPAPTQRSARKVEPVQDDAPGEVRSAQATAETQAAIAQIWSGLLGVSDIRAEDNFFALGGHSLLAVQAHRDIKAALGRALSITDIFRFPTLEGLAAHLDRVAGSGSKPRTSVAPKTAPVQVPERKQAQVSDATNAIIEKRRQMRQARARAAA